MICRRIGALAAEVFDQWSCDDAPRLSAALAYYTILSSAPLLVISIALADRVIRTRSRARATRLGNSNVSGGRRRASDSSRPARCPSALQRADCDHSEYRHACGWRFLRGGGTALRSQSDLGCRRYRTGLLARERHQFREAAILLVAGGDGGGMPASWFRSFSASSSPPSGSSFAPCYRFQSRCSTPAAFVASFLVVTLLFGAIYKLLPDVHLRWSDVLIGASVTSLLFTIGKQLLALYLGRVGFESTYGAAWTVVIVLVWVYYSAQLFFLGAEFTKVYTRTYGSHRSGPSPRRALRSTK